MPIDVSMYPKANPPVNPMEQVGTMMGVIGQINQNKLFQQEFAARRALGPIYAASMIRDPITGETRLDPNKLLQGVADNPDAGFKAAEIAAAAQLFRTGELANASTQFKLYKDQYEAGNTIISSLPKNAGPQDGLKAINDAVSNGQVPYQMGVAWAADMLKDPTKFPEWLQQRRLQTMDAKTRADYLYGTIQTIQTGRTTEIAAVSPMSGVTPLASYNMSMTPGEAATPIGNRVDPGSGRETAVFKGDGGGGVWGGAAPVAPAPRAAPGAGGSAEPAADLSPGDDQPGAAPRGAQGTGRGSGYITKLGPGEAGALQKAGENSEADYDRDSKAAQQYAQQKFQFREIIDLAGKTNTGQGIEWRNALNNFVLTAGASLGFDDSAILKSITDKEENKYVEELNKLLSRNAQEYSLRFGQGGDKLAAGASANPNIKMRPQTIQDLTRMNYAMLKNQQAMVTAFSQTGKNSDQYRKFALNWNNNSDPRAFLYDLLPEDRQKELYASLKGKDKVRFTRTLKWAEDHGFLE